MLKLNYIIYMRLNKTMEDISYHSVVDTLSMCIFSSFG